MAQALGISPNAEGLYECPEKGCDKTFTRVQGLGRHLSETHGQPTTREASERKRGPSDGATRSVATRAPEPSSLVRETRDELAGIIGPLRERRREIERRLAALAGETEELRAARRDVDAVLSRLDPTSATLPKPSGNNAARSERVHRERVAAIRAFVDSRPDALADGFTATALIERMRAENAEPRMTTDTARRAIDELRDQGVLRLDRVTQGGGKLYMLVGNGSAA